MDSNEFNYKTFVKKIKDDINEVKHFTGASGRISIWKNDMNNMYIMEIKSSNENYFREVGIFEYYDHSRIELHKQLRKKKNEKYIRYDKVNGSTYIKIKNENVLLFKEKGVEFELEKIDII